MSGNTLYTDSKLELTESLLPTCVMSYLTIHSCDATINDSTKLSKTYSFKPAYILLLRVV